MNYFNYKNNKLFCENVAVEKLAKKHGTPLYIYSKNSFIEQYKNLDSALAGLDKMICFATKSNSNLVVIKTFAELNSGFDIVTGGELFKIVKAGGDTNKVVFSGVGKTIEEIKYAIEQNILFFNIESEVELKRINDIAGEMNKKTRFCVRVNPNVDPKTHKYITTGKSENKFGLDFEAAKSLYNHAKNYKNVEAVGVQMHIGSQITTTEPFVAAIKKLLKLVEKLRAQGIDVKYVDIGGGLGIVYKNETPPTAEQFAIAVVPELKKFNAKIIFEPGRFLVGNGGILVAEVQYVKKTPTKEFVILNAGMNDLLRPSLYDAYHDIIPVNASDKLKKVDVVGPICESSDFFGRERKLPEEIKSGDFIALKSCGAYGFVMASNYNTRPRGAEIIIDGNSAIVARKRETLEQLIKNEIW
ncbi:MAG: diaminopimelate decarboxylase [Chlamydiae bacterium]|nr:MAG: diaminopimelate decarboxylase [Chlamydiota bacterium]